MGGKCEKCGKYENVEMNLKMEDKCGKCENMGNVKN